MTRGSKRFLVLYLGSDLSKEAATNIFLQPLCGCILFIDLNDAFVNEGLGKLDNELSGLGNASDIVQYTRTENFSESKSRSRISTS